MLATALDDIAPLIRGEDPLDHERLFAKVATRLHSIGRRGLVCQAYSAVDIALWDLKGKVAGMPLYKLLGGSRESAPAYASDTGWHWMSPEEIVAASKAHLDEGVMGIKLRVGHDPAADAARIEHIRQNLGEDMWLGVTAHQRYDFHTASSMGSFFEEMGIDWFEEPMPCEDVHGHSRLADRLDIPLAVGASLFGRDEFEAYLDLEAVDVLQPDLTRVGGLTPWLKIAATAEAFHCPIVPNVLPEISVHLACGLPHVQMVEYQPWLYSAYVEPPALVKGRLIPPKRPGHGLEIEQSVVEKYRIEL